MAVTVGEVILLANSPTSVEGTTPTGGAVASVTAIGGVTPSGGGAAKVSPIGGVTPSGGGTAKVSSVGGLTPNAGDVVKVEVVDATTPNAGTAAEASVGNILGRPLDGSERPADGSVGSWANGSAFSDRDSVEHRTIQPGLTLTGEDINTVGQERARFNYRVDAEVEIDRRTINLVAGPLGTTVIFTPDVSQARLLVTRVLVFAVDVSGVSVQPEIDLRKTSPGDVLAQTAVGMTATGQANEFAAASPREAVLTGEDLELGIDLLATATTYQIEVITLGRVIPV